MTVYFCAERLLFQYQTMNGLVSGKAVDATSQKIIVISKIHILISWSPICSYTFNPFSLSLKCVMTLVEITQREKRGEREALQNYQHDKENRGQKGHHLFSFLGSILFSAIQIRQMKLSWKLRNGNRKLRMIMSEALVEFYQVCWRHQFYLKETVLYEFSLCCSSLIIVNS